LKTVTEKGCNDVPHIIMPAEQWPRSRVYYFCSDCRDVCGIPKANPADCPQCGRKGLKDIFSEIAERLEQSWSFFEATRMGIASWLFANEPGGEVHHMDEGAHTFPNYPLAYYAELRALGFIPPWLDASDPDMRKKEDVIIERWVEELEDFGMDREADWIVRNRIFMNEEEFPRPRSDASFVKSLSPGDVEPDLTTRESTRAYFNSLPWCNNPYSACGRIGHALDLHMARQRQAGRESFDESYHYVKELVDAQYQPGKGYWGGSEADFINRTSGNMEMLCTYARFDWPIPEPKRIIDYHLSGATEKAGFEGSGCSAFNQMHPLCCIFGQYPELKLYRGDEIDRYTAKTLMTFLGNWNDATNFYGETWLSKHNHGVVTFMTELLLDLPISRVSTIYNWRENSIITRNEDGRITRNKVIYQQRGFRFYG
jgi:hypothetical protein